MSPSRRLAMVVMIVAIAVRLWGIGFGLPAATARPDETQIAGPAVGYLGGDLRPQFFQWPTLFSYSVAAAYVAYAVVGRPLTGFPTIAAFAESRRQSINTFLYISRSLAMLMGVATVWWIFAIGRRAFDATVGLVAALFLALAFLHVRESHFGVTDTPMTALVVLAVLLIVRWRETGGVGRALLAGLVTGLAGSTKYNGLGAAAAFAAAWLVRLVEVRGWRPRMLARLTGDGAAYGVATAVGFFGASPYILIDWARFRADTGSVQTTLEHGHGTILGQGWFYYAHTILPAAIGWPMLIAAAAGIVVLLVTRFRSSVVVLAFPIAYYVVAGRGYAVFARYILPVVPFLCLAAAWFVVWAVRKVAKAQSLDVQQWAIAAAALLVVAPTAIKTVRLDRLLATTDNRVVTARILFDVVHPGDSFYQTGESYGQVPTRMERRSLDTANASYDTRSRRFSPADPQWVLVQRSPLMLYSAVPDGLDDILRERYTIARSFRVESAEKTVERLYDQQDAFFLPLTNLAGIERPGPAYELYTRNAPEPR